MNMSGLKASLISRIAVLGLLFSFCCFCTIAAGQDSYIIVHCHNPEGKEINSITNIVPLHLRAEIYDGDTFIGYTAYNAATHNQPIPMSTGSHTIKVKFNGMTMEQSININEGQTQVLTFTFTRIEYIDTIKSKLSQNFVFTESAEIDTKYISPPYQDLFFGNQTQIGALRVHGNLSMTITASGTLDGDILHLQGHFLRPIWELIETYQSGDPWWAPTEEILSWYVGVAYIDFGNIILPPTCTSWFHQQKLSSYINPISPGVFGILKAYFTWTDYSDLGYFRICYDYDGELESDTWEDYAPHKDYNFDYFLSNVPYDLDGTAVGSDEVNQPPVASFKSWNIEDIGTDQPTIIEGHHMVGGQIEFDARESSDPAGGTLTYYWDFGDGTQETTLNPVILKVYTKPEKFTVTLSVKNNKGISSTNTASEELDLSLNPGDLLVIRSGWPYAQIFDFFGLTYTHVGMYVGKIDGEYRVVESTFFSPPLSHKIGVQETPIERWGYPHETYVDVVRVTNDPEIATRAVAFARGLALDPHPHIYDTTLGEKQIDCSSLCPYCLCDQYYCSELVWAAYYRASDGAIDLSADAQKPLLVAVSPDDIFNYPLSTNVGWHHEKYPPKNVGSLSISVLSPVDISVTDPSGLTITKESSQILDAAYVETDLDEDNDIDDVVIIPEPKLGDYLILVIPEPNVLPTDTYSLEVVINGQRMVLAQDVQIQNIPSEPYIIESKLNPADFDNDGDVDFYDYAAFASRWMSADCHYPDWCEGKDLDYSGLVDFMDLSIFTENWLWEKILADIDIDGDVDFVDYAVFANHWMEQDCAEPNWCSGADLDKSGSVDLYDLGKFADNWLEGTAP